MDPAVLSWSGGKDATFALHAIREADDPEVRVERLLTTYSAETERTTMHGVRPELIERQAEALGLPLDLVELPPDPSNEAYEAVMAEAMAECADRGLRRVVFADLFLEGIREYREGNLRGTALSGHWPVWGRDTDAVAAAFLDAGYRAVVVCVDGDTLGASFAGREFDRDFLADRPGGVDPCGENGEFHTFVYDGPAFESAVAVETGDRVTREVGDGVFHYCDLVPGE
jgi:uncharacterized protein (TIGR00290 family)